MRLFLLLFCLIFTGTSDAWIIGDVQYSLLLGPRDACDNAWVYSGDSSWHQVTGWTVTTTPTQAGLIKISAMPHIRSGDGAGHSRLYNKVRIVRLMPTPKNDIAINSESNWEGTFGYGDQIRFFDASRTVFGIDTTPVLGQPNVYGVEVIAGDGLHVEICIGSPLLLEYFIQ